MLSLPTWQTFPLFATVNHISAASGKDYELAPAGFGIGPCGLWDHPVTTDALDAAECVFLIAVRSWVADYRKGEDPLPRLCDFYARAAGTHDAAFSVDRLMAVVARTCRPCRHSLSTLPAPVG